MASLIATIRLLISTPTRICEFMKVTEVKEFISFFKFRQQLHVSLGSLHLLKIEYFNQPIAIGEHSQNDDTLQADQLLVLLQLKSLKILFSIPFFDDFLLQTKNLSKI